LDLLLRKTGEGYEFLIKFAVRMCGLTQVAANMPARRDNVSSGTADEPN